MSNPVVALVDEHGDGIPLDLGAIAVSELVGTVDRDHVLRELDALAREAAAPPDADIVERVARVSVALFSTPRIRGTMMEDVVADKARIDVVLENGVGISAVLATIHAEVARRAELELAVCRVGDTSVVEVVQAEPTFYLDGFNLGAIVDQDAMRNFAEEQGAAHPVARQASRETLADLCVYLKAASLQTGDVEGAMPAVDAIVALLPDDPKSWRERGLMRRHLDLASGRDDLERYLELRPDAPDVDFIREKMK